MTVVFSSKMDTCPFQNRFLNSCDSQNFIFLVNVKKMIYDVSSYTFRTSNFM